MSKGLAPRGDRSRNGRYSIPAWAALIALLLPVAGLHAQPERLANGIREAERVSLGGSVHPLARPESDLGPVDPNLVLGTIVIGLSKTAQQQKDLDRLLNDQQDTKSLQYHQWLTPERYADRFGVNPKDMAKIKAWLESEGFQVLSTGRGRDMALVSGTAAQVQRALRTAIHQYRVDGEVHFANAGPVSIPKDLAALVTGFRGLDDFIPKPPRLRHGTIRKPSSVRGARPQITDSQGNNYLVPDDVSTIYNAAGLSGGGTSGSGQTIAVAGSSDIDMTDIETFRKTFNLPANDPTRVLVPNTQNPGQNGEMGEADLDLEWAGAMAPNAHILYVFSPDLFLSAFYAIDQDLAPVLSTSFGACEWHLLASDFSLFRNYSQKAAAEGITWVASSGDAGAAGCEVQGGMWTAATTRLSVLMPASLPEVTAVGGTEFNEGTRSYYSPTPGPNGGTALSYIPEVAWNDEAALLQASSEVGVLQEEGYGFAASGGGPSRYWAKPSWQSGTGVPADGARDVPDIAFSASPYHDAYLIVTGGNLEGVGGTSVSTPVFAGMLALLNQYLVAAKVQSQPGLGNINPMLYGIAQSNPGVYHDITSGSNQVPCAPGSTQDCPSSGVYGYSAGTGYDMVTGWGSIDLAKLATAWAGTVGTKATLIYDVTTKQAWNGSCGQSSYPQASTFSPTDTLAGLYLELNNVSSSDQVTDQWIRPDGVSYASGAWSNFSGNVCLYDSMNIAGAPPASLIGGWHVRTYLNGTQLFDLPFTITSVQLTAYMMTKSTNTSTCATPAPATTFSSTDPSAAVWFNVAGANIGDTATVQWINPSGNTYATGNWNPLTSAGSYCFISSIGIAGHAPATTPGTWTVQATWNGLALFTLPFTITNP